ncbi:MAG: sigma 54-interacting transcriptional regulator [Desulfobacterales bacterium]|jgi:PAS domain S-box-containing protein|nr:sigma 54-interacting transcriptional regulator [Desulfobacterales bacterium]
MNAHDLNQYWKTVVNTIQDGVMIVNPDGTIISINKGFENISGYTHDEIVGQSCAMLQCSACEIARQGESCHWCVMFRKGELRKQKCLLTRKDGRNVHILKNASVLKDSQGNIIGAVETITDITDLMDKEMQIETIRRELEAEDRFHGMIGSTLSMKQVFELIENASQSDAPVILYGESGTGKELMARAIHEAGCRSNGPYIKVNCAALNESLLESELFGHVKGAYTGAHRSREGRFEAASGGDIFLDEIGDLPLSIQVKLLRVLEENVIERVGDHSPINVDVRIISATNRDLPQLIARGDFREDLYYRINVIPIHVPPLRERMEDIPLLARLFFSRIQLKSGKTIHGISDKALEALMKYEWPGNIRELKSAFEFAFVSCQEKIIEPHHLPPNIFYGSLTQKKDIQKKETGDLLTLNDIKKQRLTEALRIADGNQSETARLLGISRTSVWNQMKRFGIREQNTSS